MYVLTVDQVDSRRSADAVDDALDLIRAIARERLALAPERTVGDEVQAATTDAACCLELILALARSGAWSVGCGIGGIESLAVTSVRAARGPAFIAARDAVEAAKKRPLRVAVRADGTGHLEAADTQALLDLLLALRARRTEAGWQVFDLLDAGTSQKAVAQRLGITEQAVSLRARAAQLAAETEATPALVRMLQRVEDAAGDAPDAARTRAAR